MTVSADAPRHRPDGSGDAPLGQGVWLRLVVWARASGLFRIWRRSLQFRTVFMTVLLSGAAVLLTTMAMSHSIAGDLFRSRLDQVLGESAQATRYAQQVLDGTDAAGASSIAATVGNQLRPALIRATPSSNNLNALLRTPGQGVAGVLQDQRSPRLPLDTITPELRAQVAAGQAAQYWQSVTLRWADGTDSPGIVVGTLLQIPVAGQYELYIVFDLADEAATLRFIQQALLVGGLALVVLIGVVTWVIVRLVVRPIRTTADTSQRLAAGELEVRLPQHGEDEIAALWRSFNEMADSLQSQINRLATLSSVQQRFVADVSHELRTPLTTIRLAGEVLYNRRDTFDAITTRSIELLNTQVQRFEELLGDLLEISRHDAGAATLEIEPVRVAELVGSLVEDAKALAAERGSEIEFIAEGGHGMAEIDPRRIRRVVRNLIDNAIEHGEGRPITVSVDSDEATVAVSVRDRGVGIEPANLERVFERFWRADPARRRTLGGTGLGLAISQEDTALHGGWLQVWSEPGAGTNFRLTLPRKHGATVRSSPLPLQPPATEGDAQ